MFGEKQEPFLIAAWTEVPALACPFERSDERPDVFVFTVVIRALDACNTF